MTSYQEWRKRNAQSSNPREYCDRCHRWMRKFVTYGAPQESQEVFLGKRFFGVNSQDATDEGKHIDAVWCVRCHRETGRLPKFQETER